MPELPEVETVVRELRESLVGVAIIEVEVAWPRTVASPDPDEFASALTRQEVTRVDRRGKWIHIGLSRGQSLLIHLRMTGRLLLTSDECPDERHLRVRFKLADGRTLWFCDTRKFGRMWLVDDAQTVLGELGPEPLGDGFTAVLLQRMLTPRRGRIKPLLLNQRIVAGLGNIYADEVLWRARIHPLRRADRLSAGEVRRLHASIQAVLRRAIASRGTTLDDGAFVGAHGEAGEFAERLAVYGRKGEPCRRCGSPVERIRLGQRSTHLCPNCQAPPEPPEGDGG